MKLLSYSPHKKRKRKRKRKRRRRILHQLSYKSFINFDGNSEAHQRQEVVLLDIDWSPKLLNLWLVAVCSLNLLSLKLPCCQGTWRSIFRMRGIVALAEEAVF
jgi:hypothetical protein